MYNWRNHIKNKEQGRYDWRTYRLIEFVDFIERAALLAKRYQWNFWGGGCNNLAITLSQDIRNGKSISIRLTSNNNYSYYASYANGINPNRIEKNTYTELVGNTTEEALEYISKFLKENPYDTTNASPCLFLGGAYDRLPLKIKWANEALIEEINPLS